MRRVGRDACHTVMPSSFAAVIEAAAASLRQAQRVVVLSGSGVSAESGIPTFREPGGVWDRYRLERYSSVPALARTALSRPGELVRFLHDVIEPVARAEPNAAHRAIAQLERHVHATVVTQNVDGLHQEAGSHGVRQLHGSLLEVRDPHGRVIRRLSRAELAAVVTELRRSQQAGRLALPRALLALRPLLGVSRRGAYRPNVVLFGEPLREPDWEDAQRGADLCDAMLIIGTSGLVMPAAQLPLRASMRGATTIMIDPGAPLSADIVLAGKAGEVMPKLVRAAFG